MTITEALVSRNAAYSADVLSRGGLAAKGTQKVAVVACMDSRVDVFAALGLAPGEAHVIRNAGGIVTEDTIRSIARERLAELSEGRRHAEALDLARAADARTEDVRALLVDGADLHNAGATAAQELGLPRRDVYQLALGLADRD